MPRVLRTLREVASFAKHRMFPSPDVAAWQYACRVAESIPRFTPGRLTLGRYDIEFADLLTLCPQWSDIFVNRILQFTSTAEAPRILDCGANVGLASLYFKRLYPRARITAFEADPALAQLCRRNMEHNGASDVDVRHAAVWVSGGVVRFSREGADAGAIEGTSSGLGGPLVEVASVRLRDLLEAEPIDLLKLDIEGAEGAVLADCADSLGRVSAVLLDLHEFDPGRRQTPEAMQILERAGFRVMMSEIVPLPWRANAAANMPFPGSAVWATCIRAWRP